MDWGSAYTAKWRVMKVDIGTWADDSELTGVTSVGVSRDGTDSVPLLETGTMNVDLGINDNFEDGWYRIEMLAIQYDSENGRIVERHPVSTLLFQSSTDTINRNNKSISLNGYSVLKPASDRKLLAGTYAPKGIGIGTYCSDLLGECILAPVSIDDDDDYLSEHVVFDVGMSYLEAVWMVLDNSGWCMQIDGQGIVHILKKPTDVVFDIDRVNARMLGPEITGERDLSDVPNRYFATEGDQTAVATNEDLDSPTSYFARGNRWVDYVDTYPTRLNGETLTAYAQRQLRELSTIYSKKTYSREYIPNIYPFDLVRGSLKSLDMPFEMRVLSQDITCGIGVYVTETVGVEEVTYSE